jgi:hypothetical protein
LQVERLACERKAAASNADSIEVSGFVLRARVLSIRQFNIQWRDHVSLDSSVSSLGATKTGAALKAMMTSSHSPPAIS